MRHISECAVSLLLLFVTLPGMKAFGQSEPASAQAPALSPAQDSGRALSLEECFTIASEGNVNVKNTRLDYMSAKMLKREAFAHYFPTVDIRAVGFHALNPLVRITTKDVLGTSAYGTTLNYYVETMANMYGIKPRYETLSNAYGAAVILTQPIFAGGRIVNSNKLASLGIEAASLNESIARRDASTDIEKKYWLAVSLEQKMNVVNAGLKLAESLYKDVNSALSSGLATVTEKEEVEIGRQDLNAKRIRLKGGIMLARMDLCNAIGLESSEALDLVLSDQLDSCSSPDHYYVDPSGVVPSLEEAQLLKLAVKQKQLEKKLAMGEALPEIGVGALYGYGQLIGTPQTNGMVFASLKIPITDWSIADSKMKNLDYQLEKATNQRDYLCSMLELQLRQLWVEVESTWEELQLKEESVLHAREIMTHTTEDFNAGMATRSQLMEKQLNLSNAECDRIDARIAYRNAVAAFQSRCGE